MDLAREEQDVEVPDLGLEKLDIDGAAGARTGTAARFLDVQRRDAAPEQRIGNRTEEIPSRTPPISLPAASRPL